MSYFKLINGIKDILRTDARVITITEGYTTDFDAYRQNIPVMAHIIIESGTVEDNFNVYNVQLWIVDIVVENNNLTEEKFLGNDNLQEVYELTDNIARRFYMYLKRNSVGEDIYIDGSPTFDKVEETQTENRLAGWLLNFSVGVPNPEIDICVNP
jgi:hypothetical protein